MMIGHAVAQIWRFLDFSKWRPSAIVNFKNFRFSQSTCVIGVIVSNFLEIGQTVADI